VHERLNRVNAPANHTADDTGAASREAGKQPASFSSGTATCAVLKIPSGTISAARRPEMSEVRRTLAALTTARGEYAMSKSLVTQDGPVATGAAVHPGRAELGRFLKASRAKVRPQDVGLPPGPRRRTPGLRREEVALLAGVGLTWYTWLEQGRQINASAQVLDAVSRTLGLDAAGRWHLYRLAGATPLRTWAGSDQVSDSLRAVVHSLDPLPAVLINSRFDVIESNDAHEDLFWEWHSLPCVHKNLLWCCVTEPEARDKFPDYDREVPHMVARLRAAYGRHVGDQDWEEDIRRLADLSPEFGTIWERQEVAGPQERGRRYIHPDVGVLSFSNLELDVSSVPELRISVHSPSDAATRDRLPLTRRGRG
jgi:transcriptional regulator with XRE-family HTH domain